MGTKILVIEDEQRIADFLLRGLREEGYTVDHAADGIAGWQALSIGSYDLVMLDWWLPGEEGLQVLQRFRVKERETPVLFLTARDDVASRVEALDAGADDYLCKPFSYEELLARVRALLRRPKASTAPVLRYQDLVIDLAAQRATRAGQPLDLTAKELSLLILLTRNVEKVLSRTRIYEAVWDDQYDGLSNTLEVHVKELRRKLEAHGPRLIQTRRGIGYVMGHAYEGDA